MTEKQKSKGPEFPFPIGAWVKDALHERLTSGLVHDGHGGVRFEPSAGEIVAQYDRPWPAYKIVFGGSSNIIFADQAECRDCRALRDDTHLSECPYGPQSPWRLAAHLPGYAPD